MTEIGWDADRRWQAVTARERTADGVFVYAVVTTGVYCRPNCAARRPKLDNVRFFASNEEAEKAGFRPCKRCKPDCYSRDTRAAAAISKASALIQAAEGAPDLDAIAKAVGMSRHHFHREFKRIAGMTPGAYFRALREGRAIAGLKRGATVTEAIYEAGYGSSSRFYEILAPKLGLKPGSFAKGGAGEAIYFAIGDSTLGKVLVAATVKGVCAIELGDDPGDLIEALRDRFPATVLLPGDKGFEEIVAMAIDLVDKPGCGFLFPLHVRGTVFQMKVWDILREIEPGATMTYKEIAVKAGMPSAVRAVANACASNKIAVAIPCHRVVRTGGAISGYRWGVNRKAALLERERKS